MKKRTLTLLFGLLTLGATGHFLWAQTTGGGNALNSPDSIHSRFTVEQLKVYNANYEPVFFTSFDGILS